MHSDSDNYPYAGTRAAVMLRKGLDFASKELGLSIRTLGKQLGYKQASVLSHMASGRVPIPLERVVDIATAIKLSAPDLLIAAVEQRVPGAGGLLVDSQGSKAIGFVHELESLAGQSLESLPEEHKAVIKEVVRDRAPRRRWLSLPALHTVAEIAKERPDFAERGLERADLNYITGFLAETS